MDKAQAKLNLQKLVERFKSEFESGKTNAYTEEDTKKSFIEPLLSDVLGWNTRSRDEVTMEERVSRDRVDYGIKLDGKIRFFVEAKPVKADLEKAIPQAVKYCYNRKDVPFVMLTDFEGLMFFDATFKPDARHAKKGLKINLKWDEYVEKFDELWQISRPAVMEGSLEKLFTLKPKDRVPVDKAILSDLENWREALAKNLYKLNLDKFQSDNRDSDAHFLKEITQKILDRVIFIRFCEDRQLIQIRPLKPRFDERGENAGDITYTYILNGIFKEYENVFNSDLFKRQDWETDLKIDFKVMNEIVQETYDPYMFDAIPLEVLGNIYEQYLGYTIKLAGDSIKYELKPEVRKAGGVYYTPEYIVDYIVKNTVGKMLIELPEAKSKKLRILDPACGSGSFLIRAYEEMLKYYLELKKKGTAGKVAKREAKDKKSGQVSIEAEGHEEKLTVAEKAMILKDHIYGVDIDDQAVEVTKLSLMLKMLEGEWGFVKGTAVLPMLNHNIKCGNSIVSGNVLELNRYFGDNFHKVKPFNWESEFKDVITDESGFDVVIGNPPYIFGRDWKALNIGDDMKKYLSDNYKVSPYQMDMFSIFMEKGMQLCKYNGRFGMIVPNVWLTNSYSSITRSFILKSSSDLIIMQLPSDVFENITVDTMIYTLKKAKTKALTFNIKKLANAIISDVATYDISEFENGEKPISTSLNNISYDLIMKIKGNHSVLSDFADITRGVHPYRTGGYGKSAFSKGSQIQKDVDERPYHSKTKKTGYRPFIYGKDLNRFTAPQPNEYINYGNWLAEPRDSRFFENTPRVYSRKILGQRLIVTIDKTNSVTDQQVYISLPRTDEIGAEYLAGVLGSRLIAFFIKHFYDEMTNAFPQIKVNQLKNIPIIRPRKQIQEEIEKLVEQALKINNYTEKNSNIKENESYKRQILVIDTEIDELVYELYGITEKEKKIVEEK